MSELNISNFIWNIADDVLRDVYVRGKYRDVILPMTVIRRLDAVLEPSKDSVLKMKEQLDKAGIANQDSALCQASGEAFYNTSMFRLRDLASRASRQQLKADFEAYLDGFSPNVQEVLDKFKFRNQIPTLVEADTLGYLFEKFLDPTVNLSPNPVLHQDGRVRLPGLDNHSMGTIFEELIRRFNEENNEEAGEHFTPRDVVELMAYLIFVPIGEKIQSGTYLVYDGACGTGGMLTVAEETLVKLASDHEKEVSVHLYGQEVNPETFAISKADLILKGEGAEAENMKYGSTSLSAQCRQDGCSARGRSRCQASVRVAAMAPAGAQGSHGPMMGGSVLGAWPPPSLRAMKTRDGQFVRRWRSPPVRNRSARAGRRGSATPRREG